MGQTWLPFTARMQMALQKTLSFPYLFFFLLPPLLLLLLFFSLSLFLLLFFLLLFLVLLLSLLIFPSKPYRGRFIASVQHPAHTNPAGAPGPTPNTHISGLSTFHQSQRALGHETVTPTAQRGPEGATGEWRKVSFSGMKTPPWNIQFSQRPCALPAPQNSREGDQIICGLHKNQKDQALCPPRQLPLPSAQGSSKWRLMEAEKFQGKCARRCLNHPP